MKRAPLQTARSTAPELPFATAVCVLSSRCAIFNEVHYQRRLAGQLIQGAHLFGQQQLLRFAFGAVTLGASRCRRDRSLCVKIRVPAAQHPAGRPTVRLVDRPGHRAVGPDRAHHRDDPVHHRLDPARGLIFAAARIGLVNSL